MRCNTRVLRTAVVLLLLARPAASYGQAQEPSAGGQVPRRTDPSSPFLGGVPHGEATATPLPLTLRDAIDQGLAHNLGVLLQEQGLEAAHGSRWQALSGLLPDASARVGQARRLVSLAEFGFTEFPGVTARTIGPFNVFDARVVVSQPVLDISALNDARAGRALVTAAKHDVKSARELVVLVVANLYLRRCRRRAARIPPGQRWRPPMRSTGSRPISKPPASRPALTCCVRRSSSRPNGSGSWRPRTMPPSRACSSLAPWGCRRVRKSRSSTRFPYAPLQQLTLEAAMARAYSTRPDYLAAQALLEAAEASERAARTAFLPSLHVNGEAGRVGLSPSDTDFIYGMGASVRIPVFDRGRQQARLATATADLQRRRALLADMRGSIDFDVRSAFLDVHAAEQALEAARVGRELATQQLAQSRDRFSAGVAGSLEVVQSQEAVAAANDNYTSALYAHNIAKATLARAVGVAEDATKAFLGGAP